MKVGTPRNYRRLMGSIFRRIAVKQDLGLLELLTQSEVNLLACVIETHGLRTWLI